MASSSIPAATICRSTISYINQHLDEPGKSYIFINGVNNDINQSEEAALNISIWLNNKSVVLFHNPTKLDDQRITAEQTSSLAKGLLCLIKNEFRKCRETLQEEGEIKVYVFSHSHGSILTKHAMEILGSSSDSVRALRDKIEIISFGGGVLIPKDIASKVHNFVNEFDLVTLLANSLVPSGSDADQLIKSIGSSGRVQQIFSEILLYQQSGDHKAGQAVKSALVAHHQFENFGKTFSAIENARNEEEAYSKAIMSGIVLFEGIWHSVGLALENKYCVCVKKLQSDPHIDDKTGSMLAQIIRNPYSGESIRNVIALMFQRKIDFLEAHKFNTYLKSVSPEKIFS